MSDPDLETALRATLADRAAAAPAGDDLADTVVRVGVARQRRRRLAGAAAVLAVGVLAGLAGRGLVPLAGDTEPEPAATDPADAVTELVTCGTGWPAFDPALLTERPRLDPYSELGTAVRTTARPPIATSQIDRWTLIGEVGSRAYLLIWMKNAPDPALSEYGIGSAVYERSADGTWSFAGSGGCRPERYIDDGLQPASWSPRTPPDPSATSIAIDVSSDDCASGRSPADRLTEPIVEYHADTVVITARLRPQPLASYTCQSSPPAPMTVRLDEPLGDRQLLDGRWYPPRSPEPVG